MSLSVLERVAQLPTEERAAYFERITDADLELLLAQDWSVLARPEQRTPEGDGWAVWFLRGGRGAGKGRAGAEFLRESAEQLASHAPEGLSFGLVSPRLEGVRLTQVESESGLARVLPRSWWTLDSWDRTWNRGVCELHLSVNGTPLFIKGYSSEKPANLRGPNWHRAWLDEPGTFRDAHLGTDEDTTWTNAMFCLRAPPLPRAIVTGTPRNNRLIKEIRDESFVIETISTTFDNLHNLAPLFRATVVDRYINTRLGRQELFAEILEGLGQIFQRGWFQEIVPTLPDGHWHRLRFWDLASTEPWDGNRDPDWTVGALVAMEEPPITILESGEPYRRPPRIAIENLVRFRKRTGPRNETILRVSTDDGLPRIGIEQEPGRTGPDTIADLTKYLKGVAAVVPHPQAAQGAKIDRAQLLAGPAEQGRVLLVRTGWDIDAFHDECDEAPDGAHDDMWDAVCSAIAILQKPGTGAATVSGGSSVLSKGAVVLR